MDFFKKKNNNKRVDNNNFINPEVLEVNLVKDEVGVEFNWNKHLFSLFLTMLVAGLFVVEIYYGLSWWQKQEEAKTANINAQLQAITKDIKTINANSKDFTSFKEKLSLTKNLADNHVYWTDFFNWLEKNTLNTVSYGGFSGDTSGSYSLAAAAKNFSDISWQVKAFKNDPFTDEVEVDSGSSSRVDDSITADGSVSFLINLKVKPQIFYRPAQ